MNGNFSVCLLISLEKNYISNFKKKEQADLVGVKSIDFFVCLFDKKITHS